MDSEKLKRFKNLLREKKREVLLQITHLEEITQTTVVESTGANGSYTHHMADQGTDAMEREKAFLFLAREKKYLQCIKRALNRIAAGEYGICRICGEEIDEQRLEIVPTTCICVPCKTAEKNRKK